jgi:ADP-ribose pyrophosphatase
VTVLASTEEGSFLLVRQYRLAVGAETLELHGGHVEDGELPEATARRELAEETGHEAKKYELHGTLLPDTGQLGNKVWCFYAEDATQMRSPVNRKEGIQLVRCQARDLIRQVMVGKINNSFNMAVLLLAAVRGCLSIAEGR